MRLPDKQLRPEYLYPKYRNHCALLLYAGSDNIGKNQILVLTNEMLSDIILMLFGQEPLAQAAEHLPFKQGVPGSIPGWLTINGPLVKRLRHRPFTAESWVRFPYGSP